MTAAQAGSSLTEQARLFDAGAHVVSAAFLDGAPSLALADGIVLIGEPDAQKRVVAHPDASILTAVTDGKILRALDYPRDTNMKDLWSALLNTNGVSLRTV